MDGNKHTINEPLARKYIWATAHSFLMRARACNALFHGHPDGYQSPSVASMNAHELPLWYIDAFIDDSTDKVHIPAIMNEFTGEINVVIDPVIGEKKEHRYLMKDPATRTSW